MKKIVLLILIMLATNICFAFEPVFYVYEPETKGKILWTVAGLGLLCQGLTTVNCNNDKNAILSGILVSSAGFSMLYYELFEWRF